MYKLYLWHKNERMCKFNVLDNDPDKVYDCYSKKLIINGFKNNIDVKKQVLIMKRLMDELYQQKINCQKIRASDLLMFLSCFFAVRKLDEMDTDNFIFLKVKNKNNKNSKICGSKLSLEKERDTIHTKKRVRIKTVIM